ncbi:unnamed protein product [Cochlearia groenlandica]
MKNQKSKVLIYFLFTLVLLLSCMTSSVITTSEDGFASPKPSPSSTHEKELSGEEVECKGSDSEEECLVKKSVAVHTDYIYTQDLNHSP